MAPAAAFTAAVNWCLVTRAHRSLPHAPHPPVSGAKRAPVQAALVNKRKVQRERAQRGCRKLQHPRLLLGVHRGRELYPPRNVARVPVHAAAAAAAALVHLGGERPEHDVHAVGAKGEIERSSRAADTTTHNTNPAGGSGRAAVADTTTDTDTAGGAPGTPTAAAAPAAAAAPVAVSSRQDR